MNIVTIISDEHSASAMSFSGDSFASTPNLDRLAAASTTFSNAYTSCPVCAPARASWFTGQFVCNLGTWDNSTPYDGRVEGMASWMGKYGIPVSHIGKTHFHVDGEYGFKDFLKPGLLSSPDLGCYYRDEDVERIGARKRFQQIGIKTGLGFDDEVVEAALPWLDRNADGESPWCLNIGLIRPHFPFYVTEEHWKRAEAMIGDKLPSGMLPPYTSLNGPLRSLRRYFASDSATDEIKKKVLIGYYASIMELDEHIGMILDMLEEKNLLANTAVIYTSDHGEQLGYHGLWWKCCMFEESARIPLMVYHPDIAPSIVAAPVSLADIVPTMCDLLGIDAIPDADGQSLYRLMRDGQDPEHRDFAFSEYNCHGMAGGMYMIRWRQFKAVFYTDALPQLFDLEEDPHEDNDLILSARDRQSACMVLAECFSRLLSICDPFEVTARSKDFQKRMKEALKLPESYTQERSVGFVPHPEYRKKGGNR